MVAGVARGCSGDLQAAFEGSPKRPGRGPQVAETTGTPSCLRRNSGDEAKGCREIRKHVPWYFKGYPVGGELR